MNEMIQRIIPEKNGISIPGMPIYGDDVERYIVKNDSLLMVEVNKGDSLVVKQTDGLQACELVVFNEHGISNVNIFGNQKITNASIFKQHLTRYHQFKDRLKSLKFMMDKLQAISVFDNNVDCGKEKFFISHENAYVLLVSENKENASMGTRCCHRNCFIY